MMEQCQTENLQALGPVALVSLILGDGLAKAIPGSDINDNPNQPADPALQDIYNRAAVQASRADIARSLPSDPESSICLTDAEQCSLFVIA